MVLLGCGARSALDPDPYGHRDGATPDAPDFDGGRDGGSDGGIDAGIPFEVRCSDPVSTAPNVPVTVSAFVTEGSFASGRWTVVEQPMGSAPDVSAPTSLSTRVTGNLPGLYRLFFEATDTFGQTALCETAVAVVAGPPIAVCPSLPIVAPVNEPIEIPGAGFDDDGPVTFRWTVTRSPAGSFSSLDPVNVARPTFFGDTAGSYELQLTVTDIFELTDSCEVTVRLIAPPVIECPAAPFMAPTRQPFTVALSVGTATSIARHDWSVVTLPPGSGDVNLRPAGSRATLTPQRQGVHELLYRATDTDGLSSECLVTVIGTPTPPTLTCPAVVEGRPLTDIVWSVGVADDGLSTRLEWNLGGRPEGSAASLRGSTTVTPSASVRLSFQPDIAGEYTVVVTATDEDGQTARCETLVRALVNEGLRVEMFWDTDGTDMDLHLLNPTATRWFSSDDCYYANCLGGRLSWGGPGPEDDPSLDLDNTSGRGPENINIDEPFPGTYRVGVHAFRGNGRVSVRIYCGGSTTEPRVTFGPTALLARGGGGARDFWRVADVTIEAGGRCTVTPLTRPGGGADIITSGQAERMR